ncbi:MAG: metallophosphoesterase [Verrucomicrobia bacterium]|nr:metallophosphoesterase [Verrucomicrobiota bacterium]
MKTQPYDLIGDIHGQHDKLTALLDELGYRKHDNTHRHPEGRQVVFLGDYIDRGPKIRETLHTVRNMVDAGNALAIMGNHEFNAIAYATPDGNGDYLRKHTEKNTKQHLRTLKAFKEHKDEWTGWVEWMKRLPMFLDLGDLRVVHASWDDRHLEMLSGTPLLDADFLRATAIKGAAEYIAAEILLKGPELKLPEGVRFFDKEGIGRSNVRVRWWDLQEGANIGDLVMPDPMENLTEKVTAEMLRDLPNYGASEPPVFFGHYWMPPTRMRQPLAANIVCLDYSGAFGDNPLCAYRWDGDREVSSRQFIATHSTDRVLKQLNS